MEEDFNLENWKEAKEYIFHSTLKIKGYVRFTLHPTFLHFLHLCVSDKLLQSKMSTVENSYLREMSGEKCLLCCYSLRYFCIIHIICGYFSTYLLRICQMKEWEVWKRLESRLEIFFYKIKRGFLHFFFLLLLHLYFNLVIYLLFLLLLLLLTCNRKINWYIFFFLGEIEIHQNVYNFVELIIFKRFLLKCWRIYVIFLKKKSVTTLEYFSKLNTFYGINFT